ncbi:hypothetical protein [Acetobacter estunensis]|uniref:hypothetical protein n=1 Tax=Acetobacter estunensis TaxID=104097 RepID=UPI001C2D4B3D|nr:hypothetical protein [Acetobacter estunensis]MBV1838454.1 hypothetical protein [Acetobacter estunensis]
MSENNDEKNRIEENKKTHRDRIKHNLVHDLFVHTADENYMSFRVCLINGIDNEMSWQAAHSIEKYIKAVLSLNGVSVKDRGISHDICTLYNKLEELAPDLIPDELISGRKKIKTKEFIKHLSLNGDPNNRYGVYGYGFSVDDMLLVDSLVFSVRRLTCDLSRELASEEKTYRQKFLENPEYMPTLESSPLHELINNENYRGIRNFVLDNNNAFAPKDFTHTELRIRKRSAYKTNPFVYYISQLCDAEKSIFLEWIKKNIVLPKGLYQELRDEFVK